MEIDKVVVERDDVSPPIAEFVQTYFVEKCNQPDRPNTMFTGATGRYDEATNHMVVEAALAGSTSPVVGRIAVDRAFQFAYDMLAS